MTTMPPSPHHSAEYTLIAPPPPLYADGGALIAVGVRNTGAAAWTVGPDRPFNLSYHWLDAQGRVVEHDGARTYLPRPIAPGESADLELFVETPAAPGSYRLAVELVEEGVAWFADAGVPPLVLPVAVLPAPEEDAPCVSIITPTAILHDAVGNHVFRQLRFFAERGYRALILAGSIAPSVGGALRQQVAEITLDELSGPAEAARSRRAARHFHRSTLFVFNYPIYYPLIEAIRLVRAGAVIFDYHGITPPQLWEGPGVEALVEGQRRLDLVRFADQAIGHSDFTRGELIATGAIPAERTGRMPYVVPLDRFSPGPPDPALMARYGLRPGQTVLLYVGRMAGNKRILDLVRGLAAIRRRIPDAALLLVGDDRTPPYSAIAAEARALAAALGVAEGVVFAGPQPGEALAGHYRLADLYVTASLHEGFCIPVIEAMACGVPSVGAHTTALPDTIGPGGLTFRPEDPADLAEKALQILADRAPDAGEEERRQAQALRERLREAGRAHVAGVSPERFAANFAAVVERALAGQPQGPEPAALARLRAMAQVGRPDYQVRSDAPLVGDLIARLRRNLTAHLREPYLDPIIADQQQFNAALLDLLLAELDRSLDERRRLERRIGVLERQVHLLEHRLAAVQPEGEGSDAEGSA